MTASSDVAHVQNRKRAAPLPGLDDLHRLDPDRFVTEYPDIAAVNLACARGLPNADEHEFSDDLTLLDQIAETVRRETERTQRLFRLKPAQFHNSEPVFRLYTMEHVFRTRFGIRYDPLVHRTIESGQEWTSSDSTEVFIHGILSEKRTGTCSSLPTFAVAVGRRLGYPLKLVLAPNHTFYRWDDGDDVFNLQHTEAGGDVRPDEYFREWPRKWDAADDAINERTQVWLHSMTPRQEVSKFLCNRAILLRESARFKEALQALDAAQKFNPVNPACRDIRMTIGTKLETCRALQDFQAAQAVQAARPTPMAGVPPIHPGLPPHVAAMLNVLTGQPSSPGRPSAGSHWSASQIRNPAFKQEFGT